MPNLEINPINNIDVKIKENNLINILDNSLKENKFLDSFFGQAINTAIDIGIKTILPDLIEDEIIEIKNVIFENGLKSGIKSAVNSVTNILESTAGIFTGNFKDNNSIKMAIQDGGIIDTFSGILDNVINKVEEKNILNNNICYLIKSGKDVILNNVSNKIEEELDRQSSSIEILKQGLYNWNDFYENKNFEGMEKEYQKIKQELKKVVPLENVIKKVREMENIHKLIKNNRKNFEITEMEKELANKLV